MFLDRDGVLNRAYLRNGRPHPPDSVEQLEILPGVVDACRDLHRDGFWLGVVTNQPDVARGTQTAAGLDDIHRALRSQVDVDDVLVCPHDDVDACTCRKPAPGLLLMAAERHGIALSQSFLVGDRWRDIEAGRRAGCRTIHIDYGYAEKQPDGADAVVADLAEAARWIREQQIHDQNVTEQRGPA